MADIIGPESRDPKVSRENLDRLIDEQTVVDAVLKDLLEKLGHNTYRFDLGQYTQLLLAICVHYPTMDEWMIAAVRAWMNMNRKKVEGK